MSPSPFVAFMAGLAFVCGLYVVTVCVAVIGGAALPLERQGFVEAVARGVIRILLAVAALTVIGYAVLWIAGPKG